MKQVPVFKSLSRPDNFLKYGDTGHQWTELQVLRCEWRAIECQKQSGYWVFTKTTGMVEFMMIEKCSLIMNVINN